MIVISRADCGLKPPKAEPIEIDHHPGMVIHCTGGQRPSSLEHALERWRLVQTWHQHGNGWADIGYHYAVSPTGDVLEGRGHGVRGAHAKGHNRWLGVVLFGKGIELTPEEELGLETVYSYHLAKGGGSPVLPHNAFSRKSCPGPAPTAWVLQRWPTTTGAAP